MPRKAILIRLAIYVPLILYFGYYAWQKYRADDAPPDAPTESRKMTVPGPDGKAVEINVISVDQARQMGFDPDADRQDTPAKAPADGDAKSPAPAPAGAN